MKAIPLTKGQVAFVDDEDFERISKFSWYYSKNGYAATKPYRSGKAIYMHREVMNAPDGTEVDHRNTARKLYNCKENLRICSHSQNGANRPKQTNNTSGYKGVFSHKKTIKWRAQIRKDRKSYHLGLFDTTVEAAIAYNEKAKELFGEFAQLNVIP